MAKAFKLVHYVNHFFAGVGGEEKADVGVAAREGTVGPGAGLQKELGSRATIAATVYAGDNYFGENPEKARREVLELVKRHKPDLLVAGPAFNAGRYGYACVEVCQTVAKELGIPCVTAMNEENPGVQVYRQYKNPKVYCLPTAPTAAGMADALSRVASFALRLAAGEAIGPAQDEGYFGHGIRQEISVDKPGWARALDMLEARLKGLPFRSEIPIVEFDHVTPPPPVADMTKVKLALVTTSGVVPAGNPDRFRATDNDFWRKYRIAGISTMEPGKWITIHGGYNTEFMNKNPNLGVPLDVLREMEDSGVIGSLDDYYYNTPGVGVQISNARAMGKTMAADIKAGGADAVLLVST